MLQEISVDLDEDFIFSLMEFTRFNVAGWEEKERYDLISYISFTVVTVICSQLCDVSSIIVEPKAGESGQRLYFESFYLQPMKINLSFVRTERVNMEEARQRSKGFLNFILDVFTMTVGNVHDAPLRLNGLYLEHPIFSWELMSDRISTHYYNAVVGQLHKLIGSADFLGNPVGLFATISSGVGDMFYEPLQGFVSDKPQDLGIGLARGTASFFKKTVFGFSDTFSKFTGSMGKGLAVVTMDQDFQEQRRITRAR